MNKFTNPLENIKIASPCAADWNEMFGNERQRFCGDCKLNVYNLSGMTQREAENLIVQTEGRLCVRFYRRADGSILTKDCPVGWQAIKRNVSKTAAAFASLVFTALGAIGLTNFFAKQNAQQHFGETLSVEIPTTNLIPIDESNSNTEIYTTPTVTMGNVSLSNNRENNLIVGMMINSSETRKQIKNNRKR